MPPTAGPIRQDLGSKEEEGRPHPHSLNSVKLELSQTEASRGGGWRRLTQGVLPPSHRTLAPPPPARLRTGFAPCMGRTADALGVVKLPPEILPESKSILFNPSALGGTLGGWAFPLRGAFSEAVNELLALGLPGPCGSTGRTQLKPRLRIGIPDPAVEALTTKGVSLLGPIPQVKGCAGPFVCRTIVPPEC